MARWMKSYNIIVNKMQKCWSRPFAASVILFVLFFTAFNVIFVISKGNPVPDDQYFHFKYAYLLRTEGWSINNHFNWIQLSARLMEGDSYVVNLFQVSLIPFTYFDDMLLGLRIAESFYASLVIAIIYYIMRKDRVKYSTPFLLLLVSSSYFMTRILLSRAFVVMLGLIFLEMYLAIHRRYRLLFAITFFHVVWHQNTYFMPLVVVGIIESVRYCVKKKLSVKNMIMAVSGIILGTMLFPGFPQSLFRWIYLIFSISKNGSGSVEGSLGGHELVLVDFSKYFFGEVVMFVLGIGSTYLVGMLYFKYKKNKQNQCNLVKEELIIWVYGLVSFLWFAIIGASVISGRFFDFIFPTIVLLSAFVITALIESKNISISKLMDEWLGVFVWVFIFGLLIGSIINIYKRSNFFNYQSARLAAEWIDEQSESGEKVYLNNWSHFNVMFFSNSNNVYSMGIEPLALKNYNEGLYWKYYNIFKYNYYCEIPHDCVNEVKNIFTGLKSEEARLIFKKQNSNRLLNSIKNDFGSRFIVSDSESLNKIILLNPELIEDQFESDHVKSDGIYKQFTVFKLKK